MSLRKYAPRLVIECHSNRPLQYLYLCMGLLAQVSLFVLPWPLWLRLLLMLLFCWPLWRVWQGRCELGGVIRRLHWDEEGQWWLLEGNKSVLLQMDRENLLTPFLCLLRFQDNSGAMAVVLTPRAIGMENFRRLLVRLRLQDRQG